MSSLSRKALVAAATVLAAICIAGPAAHAQTCNYTGPLTLTTQDDQFQVNGRHTFVTFVSYFDALDVSLANVEADFVDFRNKGIKGVRILPSWWNWNFANPSQRLADTYTTATAPLMTSGGTLDPTVLSKLQSVLDLARKCNLVVDLSLTTETQFSSPPSCPAGLSPATYNTFLSNLSTALSSSAYDHVKFDLQNEGNYVGLYHCLEPNWPTQWDDYAPHLVAHKATIQSVTPRRIVSMSGDSFHLNTFETAYLARDASLNLVNIHDDRTVNWETRYSTHVNNIRSVWSNRPIYFGEPDYLNPHEPGQRSTYTGASMRTAVQNAKSAGGAGWTFHNETSFRMNGTRFFALLWPEEANFLNNFAAPLSTTSWGVRVRRSAGEIGDFDGDGRADIGDQNMDGTFWIRLNTGAGGGALSFATPGTNWGSGTTTPKNGWKTLVADFTGDGKADFADVQTDNAYGNGIWVHRNLGTGAFDPGVWNSGTLQGSLYYTEPIAGDFTGDGLADVLLHDVINGTFMIYRNLGAGAGFSLWATASGVRNPAVRNNDWSVIVADFNGDGLSDYADLHVATSQFWIHLNTGGGTFSSADWGYAAGYNPDGRWTVIVGDFNGDGLADFADLEKDGGYFWVHTNLGTGGTGAFSGAVWGYGQYTSLTSFRPFGQQFSMYGNTPTP